MKNNETFFDSIDIKPATCYNNTVILRDVAQKQDVKSSVACFGLGGRPLAVRGGGSPTRRSGRNSASERASNEFREPQAGLRNATGAKPLAQ